MHPQANSDPPLILALESSGDGGGAALFRGHDLAAERLLPEPRSHGRFLIPAIDGVLADAGAAQAELALILINQGPGSYTGLRIGQAAAETIGWALSVPILGVPCFEVMCEEAMRSGLAKADLTLIPALDARQDEVMAAAFSWDGTALKRLSEDRVLAPGRVGELAPDRCGAGFQPTTEVQGKGAGRMPAPQVPPTRNAPGGIVFGDGAARYADHFPASLSRGGPMLLRPSSLGLAAWRSMAADIGAALISKGGEANQYRRITLSYFRPVQARTIAQRQQGS